MKGRESERFERSGAPATAELPAACTLGPDDGAMRIDRWQALADTATPRARRVGHQLEVSYQPGPGVREELETLVAAEAKCCSFVTWAVTQESDHPVLYVTADLGHPTTSHRSPAYSAFVIKRIGRASRSACGRWGVAASG